MTTKVSLLGTERLFPDSYTETTTVTTLLSLIDSAVVNWGGSNGTWFFESPDPLVSAASTVQHLKAALRETLRSYPMLCGKLGMSPFKPDSDLNEHRYGRVNIRYHDPEDPGVEFVSATFSSTLSSVIPSIEERVANRPIWNRDALPVSTFVSSTPLAHALKDAPSAKNPAMTVQVTSFTCGGLALTISIAHSLADAHALCYFTKNWAVISRGMLTNTPTPSIGPLFDPSLLHAAVGDIDAHIPDLDLLATAEVLPMSRFDWWAKRDITGHDSLSIPEPLRELPGAETKDGALMPWETWDISAPITHVVLHITAAQISHLYNVALIQDATNLPTTESSKVSRMDVLVAHLWSRITLARLAQERTTPISKTPNDIHHCNITLGLRPSNRLSLDPAFLGSPIMHTAISLPSLSLTQRPRTHLPLTSIKIRTNLSLFTPQAIAAHIHKLAYSLSPQRIWHAFLGYRHLIVTSWARAGVYQVDFWGQSASGWNCRFAEASIEGGDGIVQIMEATPRVRVGLRGEGDRKEEERMWWGEGADVSLWLERRVMEGLMGDEELLPDL